MAPKYSQTSQRFIVGLHPQHTTGGDVSRSYVLVWSPHTNRRSMGCAYACCSKPNFRCACARAAGRDKQRDHRSKFRATHRCAPRRAMHASGTVGGEKGALPRGISILTRGVTASLPTGLGPPSNPQPSLRAAAQHLCLVFGLIAFTKTGN